MFCFNSFLTVTVTVTLDESMFKIFKMFKIKIETSFILFLFCKFSLRKRALLIFYHDSYMRVISIDIKTIYVIQLLSNLRKVSFRGKIVPFLINWPCSNWISIKFNSFIRTRTPLYRWGHRIYKNPLQKTFGSRTETGSQSSFRSVINSQHTIIHDILNYTWYLMFFKATTI